MIDYRQDKHFRNVMDALTDILDKEPKMETEKCEPPSEDVEGEKERAKQEKIGELATDKFEEYLEHTNGQDLFEAMEAANNDPIRDEVTEFLKKKNYAMAGKIMEQILEGHLWCCAKEAAERELS